ncbi:PAS domain S-box protein [Paucibacter sp. KBW04]|uniref:PAS domain S-box protein n=1 Tax=Paucibacter sp. KBW04 TaxID=2153361 RepID=UPI0018CC2CE9|nr:PAS domain S-box protein [Paucibacter sp. KBW04]
MSQTAASKQSPFARPVLEIASTQVIAVKPQDDLMVAARLMAKHRISFVPVLNEQGRPLGVLTEARLLSALRDYQRQGGEPSRWGKPAAEHKPHAAGKPALPELHMLEVLQPPLCVPQHMSCEEAYRRCLSQNVHHLMVVDEDGLVLAVASETDFRLHLNLSTLAGRRLVPSVMSHVANTLRPSEKVIDALAMMTQSVDGSVVVAVDGEPVGVLTSRDTTRFFAARMDMSQLSLGEVMSQPVQTITAQATINQAAEQMLEHRLRHLVVVDEDRQVIGMLSEHDLTRSMAMGVLDTAIENDRAHQQAVLNAIPDLVWMKDADGVYLSCNPRFEQLFGAPEAEIRGRSDRDFVSPAQAEAFREHDRLAMVSARPITREEEVVFASDGHKELLQTIKTAVRDADGSLLGVLGIGRDISTLRRVESEYRFLFEHNPAPMLIYELDGMAIKAVNPAFCTLFGYSEAEAKRLTTPELFLPEDRSALLQAVQAYSQMPADTKGPICEPLGHAKRGVGEWRQVRKDGSLVHVLAHSHEVDYGGRKCRMVALSDVSRLHRDQRRDRSRLALMESLAHGDSLPSLLEQLIRHHEAEYPDSLCSILLLKEDGLTVTVAAAPSLPSFFNEAIEGMTISPTAGSCGAAMSLRQRVVVEDINSHPNWRPFLPLTQKAGLGSCWSEPIIGPQGRVLGSFAVYRRQPFRLSDEEVEQFNFSVQLAATAITQGVTHRLLRASEGRLQDILRNLPDIVWLKNPQGEYLSVNAMFERMVNRPAAEVIGRCDADFVDVQTATQLEAIDAGVLSTRQPHTSERWVTLLRDGYRGLFEVIKTPLYDDSGEPVGVLAVARDITLLKNGARAIAEQERLIDTMFSQTTDAIVLLDPRSGAFVTFNNAACEGLGYSREAFAKLRPHDLQEELSEAQIQEMIARAQSGEPVRFETRHRRADGSTQIADLTLRSLDYAGKPLISAVWRDISEAKASEIRIRRLNQSYALLSEVNEAIVRRRNTQDLLSEVCRIAVEVGGFRMAWAGQVSEDGERVIPLLHAGHSNGYVEQLQLFFADSHSPTVRALDTGQAVLIHDIAKDARMSAWADAALQRGYVSMGAFPIAVDGRMSFALMVYSAAKDHFDSAQAELLLRLARNIGFALDFNAAELAQRKEQRFREQLIESVAGVFYVMNQEGQLLQWNRRLEEISGFSAAEISARSALDFFDGADQLLISQRIREALETGEAQAEAALIAKDGRRMPYLFVSRLIELGSEPMIIGTGIDISDRIRSEQELERYRQHLEELVDLRTLELNALNTRLSREDLRLRAMLSLSQRAGSLSEPDLLQLGLDEIARLSACPIACLHRVDEDERLEEAVIWSQSTPGQMRQMPGTPDRHPAAEESPPPHLLAAVLARRKVLRAGDHADEESNANLALCPPGIMRAMGLPFIEDDKVRLLLCVANKSVPFNDTDQRELQMLAGDLWDIIRRRRIEIALEQAKHEADAANQAKSAFLANMSHEIRTPMNAILGFAHLLKREGLSPSQLDYQSKISDASQHLLQVINDILDFSKIEAHEIQLDKTDFALAESLERVRAMLQDRANNKKVALRVQVGSACPTVLHADRLRLEQILLNLLSNAIKFTERGSVELRVRCEPSSEGVAQLRIEVQDTGIGMQAQQMSRLFEAFHQADASITRRFGGTGLGLAISKRLAQLMGGSIGVQSSPGLGSTFWVEFPLSAVLAEAQTPQPGPVQAPKPSGSSILRGARILVAEDDFINQEVAGALLESHGVVTEMADNGLEAVRKAAEKPYDLILMDVHMPEMDGLQATVQIRQTQAGATIPIIAMTASAFAEDRMHCISAGMNDFLAKPVAPDELERCLRNWLPASAGSEPVPTPSPLPPSKPAPSYISWPALLDQLLSLQTLLQSQDTAAIDAIDRLTPSLVYAFGNEGHVLNTQVQNFSFDTALSTLKSMVSKARRQLQEEGHGEAG